MSRFDRVNPGAENNFIRNDPKMLENIFGTAEVTPFWVADMDFEIAEPIKAELQRLVDRARFAYEFDHHAMFAAISNWFERRHGLSLDPGRFVQAPGVLPGIALLLRELTEEGDEILVQTPAYHQFHKLISTAERQVVANPLRIENQRYVMDLTDLDAKLRSDRVKMMILCNPHNPVGRVWTREELEKVLEIADRHGVTIVSDEIHSDIIYTGNHFTSLMALDASEHVALIGSPAKTFGMPSVSEGYIYTANGKLLDAMHRVVDSMYLGHGNAFTTYATLAAFEKGEAWLDELLIYLEEIVGWIREFLSQELPTVTFVPVEGTYQIWLDFSATGLSGGNLMKVLGQAGFGAAPGAWFDQEAKAFARMNIAAPKREIQEAFRRLQLVLRDREAASVQCPSGPTRTLDSPGH